MDDGKKAPIMGHTMVEAKDGTVNLIMFGGSWYVAGFADRQHASDWLIAFLVSNARLIAQQERAERRMLRELEMQKELAAAELLANFQPPPDKKGN